MTAYQLARNLITTGSTSTELADLTRRGELEKLRRGVYVQPAERMIEERHRLLVASTVAVGDGKSVVSFGSAAVLHGLPVWYPAVDKVHLTRIRSDGGRIRSVVHRHVAELGSGEVCVIDGLAVTSLARTFVDYARTVPLGWSVAAGDQALRAGMTMQDVDDQLISAKARRGIGRARYAGQIIDAASESPGESLSRVLFGEAGLPMPELQVELFDDGRYVARVDFLWREFGTVGEFDGLIKYGRLLRPGESAADAVIREKQREDKVRDLGLGVVRWIWDDIFERQDLVRRMTRSFGRGKPFHP
jgi:hypothetical protein